MAGELSDSDILELAEAARRAIVSQPAGFLVDPGAGSAMDRLQRDEPPPAQLCDMAKRGGHYETLYTGTSVERMIVHVVRAIEARPQSARDAALEECHAIATAEYGRCCASLQAAQDSGDDLLIHEHSRAAGSALAILRGIQALKSNSHAEKEG